MIGVLSWLMGSRLGQGIAIVALAIVAGTIAWRLARASGERAAELRQQQESLSNLRARVETDDEVRRLDPVARRERLREWATRKPSP